MSLILEALKKVERERTAPEQRGFLVLGPAAWAPTRSNAGWILAVVAAAAVAGGVVYALTRPAPAAVPAAPVGDSAVPPAAPLMEERAPAAAPSWAPPAQTISPRTRPAAVATPNARDTGPALVLHAISEQEGVPIAVINEHVVREGQTVNGVRVLRIGATEVEVEVAGTRRILRF